MSSIIGMNIPRKCMLLLCLMYQVTGEDVFEDSCFGCVASGKSWIHQENNCMEGECPIADARCCLTAECCAKTGCSSPDQNHIFSIVVTIPCTFCCTSPTDNTDTCEKKTSSGGKEPWYEFSTSIDCIEDETECPPCSMCPKISEDDLNQRIDQPLAQLCSKEVCENAESNVFVMNPCAVMENSGSEWLWKQNYPNAEGSCDCWCQETNALLEQCPHMKEDFWKKSGNLEAIDFCTEDIFTDRNQYMACNDICEDIMCCFCEDDCNCFPRRTGQCEDYAACGILNSNSTNAMTQINANLVPTVDDVCTNAIFEDGDQLEICQNMCSGIMCCFCEDDCDCDQRRTGQCGNYTACDILLEADANQQMSLAVASDSTSGGYRVMLVYNLCMLFVISVISSKVI